jgi:NadR type nicotinamide-nucleotide adenylyltransferase
MEPVAATRICLTGAECTGKTTLALALAARYAAPCSPEFAREYAERVKRPLTAADIDAIAAGQIANEDLASATGNPATGNPHLVIVDTDLVSTVVYSRHHYGDCPPWIERAAEARRADLYLLLDAGVPWTADGVRDSGARRDALHREFGETLRSMGAEVAAIGGSWKERLERAVTLLDSRLYRP